MKTSEQIDLFGKIELETLSIDAAALRLGVSTATIRNWLKTGYLVSAQRGQVTEDSLNYFQSEIAGREKLNQRANKSLKDSHDHSSIASMFLERARLGEESLDQIGCDYESSLSESYRNKEGVYYTPIDIVRNLFPAPEGDIKGATFCDPCCGSGNFIVQALKSGFKPENIYGYDLDPVAVEITKARVRQICGYRGSNIQTSDFLRIASDRNTPSFDFIYTNPPWGKKLSKNERESLGAIFKSGSSKDTCSLFFFACLKYLKKDGNIGLLLPESFFNIASFESARRKALSLSIERLTDYGKAFRGLMTGAQAIVIKNTPANPKQMVKCENSTNCFERSIDSFSCNPKSILNSYCGDEDARTLAHIMSTPYITLANQASWGLGIVTGNNKKFIKTEPADGYIPVFKGADISKSTLKEAKNFIPSDLSLYQQVAPLHLFTSKEKLVYKFISSRLCFFLDTEQRFVLNSANMLIPSDEFPISTKVLGELLSSDFMNWVFAGIFNTHKILRGDLESLPIHNQFLEGVSNFDEGSYLEQLRVKRTTNGAYRTQS